MSAFFYVNQILLRIVYLLLLFSIETVWAHSLIEQKECQDIAVVGFRCRYATTAKQVSLSLSDAILLTVRSNPNVQSSQLSYLSQKFNVAVQAWQFYPHYFLNSSATLARIGSKEHAMRHEHNYAVQPSVSLLTPIGTQMTLTSNNQETDGFHPSLSAKVIQPLMRGFGKAIVEAALNNAIDSEAISRLSVEGTLRNIVTGVINAYLDIVGAEQAVVIDEKALQRAEASVVQTKLFIQSGHKAGNELVTVEANVATAKTNLENDKNNLMQAKYSLLTAIGLDPNMPIVFSNLDLTQLIKKYQLPTKKEAIDWVLKNDIQYQTDQIALHGPTTRSVWIAEDNARWQLTLTANTDSHNEGFYEGFGSLFKRDNQSHNIALTLEVPIDDQVAKQAIFNAKIALKQAKLALIQEKWSKETNAINGWNTVVSAEKALRFAEHASQLQDKTYQLSYQKYLHGLIDSLELQSAQVQLIQTQQTLLSAQIFYLKSLVNLDLLIGHTLKTWDVKVRL